MGYGIYCSHDGREYVFADRLEGESGILRDFPVLREYVGSISNPTMELCAVTKALQMLALADADALPRSATIFSDFIGPKKWIEGEWTARAPYIKHLCLIAQQRLGEIRRIGVRVELAWVKGHSDSIGNRKADALAKGVEEGASTRSPLSALLPSKHC